MDIQILAQLTIQIKNPTETIIRIMKINKIKNTIIQKIIHLRIIHLRIIHLRIIHLRVIHQSMVMFIVEDLVL